MPEKIILDMDPGIDDALAIMLALNSPEVEVLGITTVSGNVGIEKTTRNALRILHFIDKLDVPVYRGAYKPIINTPQEAEIVHGTDGLGDIDIPVPKKKEEAEHAVNYLMKQVREYPGEITIVATGPLTNIALAILLDKEFAGNVRRIVSMGGAFNVTLNGYGNDTPVAEFNIYTDPEAAKIVYGCGADIYAVGLDVTMKPGAVVTKDMRERIRREGGRRGKLFYEMTKRFSQYVDFLGLHDPMALSYVIDDSLLQFRKYSVEVELHGSLSRGQTIADRREWLPEFLKGENNINVAVDVDGKRFLDLMWKRVFKT